MELYSFPCEGGSNYVYSTVAFFVGLTTPTRDCSKKQNTFQISGNSYPSHNT